MAIPTPLATNNTLPVSSEPSCAVTVAVMVTFCPGVDGLGAVVKTVVVATRLGVVKLKTVPQP